MSHSPIRFTRALRIAGYNWPGYAAAAVAVIVGLVLALWPGMPFFVRILGVAGAAVGGWFAGSSFWAFHSMFDRSELLDGHWLAEEIPQAPKRWVQINA